MIRRTAIVITTVVLAIATFVSPVLASPGEEASFASLINSERTNRGMNALDVYWDLVDDARVHAGVMADADKIFHSSNLAGATTGWAALGENVGVGPTVGDLHTAFMNSAGHRANILGDWDSIGVGVANTDRGYMFVTVVFMKAAEAQPEPEPEPEPEPVEAAAAVNAATVSTSQPATAAAVASASAPKVPYPAPAPEPAAEPIDRLIDDLLAGGEFPFCIS